MWREKKQTIEKKNSKQQGKKSHQTKQHALRWGI